MKELVNLLGATVAVADNLLLIALFLARLSGHRELEYWLGIIVIGSIIPLSLMKENISFHSVRA